MIAIRSHTNLSLHTLVVIRTPLNTNIIVSSLSHMLAISLMVMSKSNRSSSARITIVIEWH